MGSRDYRYRFSATDDASAVFDKAGRRIGSALKGMQGDLDQTASKGKQMAQVIEAMAADVESDLHGTEAAAERLGQALGEEFTGDARQMVDQLRMAGLSLEEIEADADDLAAAMRRLDDVAQQAGGGVRSGLDDMDDGMRRVGETADNTRSVTANFTGNLASEIPGISNAMGPLNMAIGQFGEYAAEGNIRLRNLVSAGAGMLAVAAIFQGITGAMERAEKSKAFDRDRIVGFATALRESGDAASVLQQELESTGKILVELGDFGSFDIVPALGELGMTLDQFTSLSRRSEDGIAGWSDAMLRAGANADAVAAVGAAAVDTHENLAEAERLAGVQADILGDRLGESATAAEEAQEPTQTLAEIQDGLREAAEGAGDAVGDAADAIARLHGETMTALDAAAAYEGAIDDLASTIRGAAEDGSDYNDTLDISTERGRQNLAAAQEAAGAILDLVALRYRETGSVQEATDAGNAYVEQLRAQLDQAGLTEREIDEYIDTLNLTPEDITTTIQLSQHEAASAFIATYQTQLDALPPEKRTRVVALVEGGAYVQAEQLLNYLARTRVVPVSINPLFGVGTSPLPIVGKFHGGGVVDVPGGGNEGIAVVQHDETIRTPEQEAALQSRLRSPGSGAGAPLVHLEVHGNADRDVLDDAVWKLGHALAGLTTRGDG